MSKGKSKEYKDGRTRNWTIVVYPDSAPENWRDLLDDKHIEWVESPLHDKDNNPDGTPKKPHWHVLLLFGGVKSEDQVKEFVSFLNCPLPIPCHNAKSLVRYMSHLDNPDKFQYDQSKIISHGGVDLQDLLKPSSAERYTFIKEMCNWCEESDISEFSDLMMYAINERSDDWLPLLADSCAYVMDKFLASRRHKPQKPLNLCALDQDEIDRETGEIIEHAAADQEAAARRQRGRSAAADVSPLDKEVDA